MADVYQFKVAIKEVPRKIWRKIEISSTSSVAMLGYAVLAAFECDGSHLFSIQYRGSRYEIVFDHSFRLAWEPIIDLTKTKLSELELSVGDVLHMEYDYGASWEFTIKLISVTEMKKGTGTHYPYLTAGKGKGIIEDLSPYELRGIIQETDQTGEPPALYDETEDTDDPEFKWDYRDFDLESMNSYFKDEIYRIRWIYEED